ncbi:MAG: glycosyltransferase family 4 protein [Candidatus Bathyarchaeia archaeon]|jgi:glycosyltransferase involved in cell wall biosynthesis
MKKKICFLSLSSYPTLVNKNLGIAGGAEVEQVQLALQLSSQGFDVCFITYSSGQKQREFVNGIEILKTYDLEQASKISVFHKFRSIWSSLKKANADIYFHEAGSSGVLPFFCFVYKKKYVYRIASDAVVLRKSLFGKHNFSEHFATAIEVKKADAVIAQSSFQKRILREKFGVKSVIIKNGLTIPEAIYKKTNPPVVLWVGSLSKIKNPEIFINLAKSIPWARFEMIGGRGAPPYLYQEIESISRGLPNFIFCGFVPFEQTNAYFSRASVLVNTSSMEGFPNTFIQAWANCVPVVSLNVDPDKVIQMEKLGFHSQTFGQLICDVETVLYNENVAKTLGENGRAYVKRNHDVKNIVKEYCKLFKRILS